MATITWKQLPASTERLTVSKLKENKLLPYFVVYPSHLRSDNDMFIGFSKGAKKQQHFLSSLKTVGLWSHLHPQDAGSTKSP